MPVPERYASRTLERAVALAIVLAGGLFLGSAATAAWLLSRLF